MKTRLPIQIGFLEILLFGINRSFSQQPYLSCLYKAMFALAYYGLLRIREITASDHILKANDFYIGSNKNKIMVLLHTSKTHGEESPPQKVKISKNDSIPQANQIVIKKRNFCLFTMVRDYIKIRTRYLVDFFVFADRTPVTAYLLRTTLSLSGASPPELCKPV